ncbi:DNA-binding transcriptional regulator, MarR family [Arthrobacter subterraneus]|uniref:DNA-binding transcriptional regulator, MarR family n=1 Tax=Arthrobacter subterraneus TaxID=335973 RepID=A0A1G8I7S1_9MICC|nr:MarR family transcriptional regulator [Arthrobacter subterraneus]SDI14904.1 DNA-binding transcriptional regulator, MarR family [Arthrobacter subterraneus]
MSTIPDVPTRSTGYWYGRAAADLDVLNALRDYRAAETAMRRRTRSSMGMNETDLLALRYLLEAQYAGREVSPKELTAKLGISSAATTTLIDRLARSGHVRRKPHPRDRRALVLEASAESGAEVRQTMGTMHTRMVEVARSLPPEDAAVVVDFLTRMREAVDQID